MQAHALVSRKRQREQGSIHLHSAVAPRLTAFEHQEFLEIVATGSDRRVRGCEQVMPDPGRKRRDFRLDGACHIERFAG
jgi:hypothetical protein